MKCESAVLGPQPQKPWGQTFTTDLKLKTDDGFCRKTQVCRKRQTLQFFFYHSAQSIMNNAL